MNTSQSGKDAEKTLMWLRWADTDYLAARLILLAGLLVQGAALSDTAIEKYLKSLFSHRRLPIPRTHRVSELYERIKKETGTDLIVNESYLRLLEKAYSLRYPDEVTEGFNIALNRVRLLAELDRTVKKITERFQIVREHMNEKIPLVLERAILEKDERILRDNVALKASLTSALFSNPSHSYDLRMHKGILRETEYTTATVEDGQDYEVEGFAVVNDLQFTVAYRPILESPNSASVNGLRQLRVRDNSNP
jgi:HEPN domain-containing protein